MLVQFRSQLAQIGAADSMPPDPEGGTQEQTDIDLTTFISDDDLLAIFDQLSAQELLRNAATVCKRWRVVAQSDAAWQPRFCSNSNETSGSFGIQSHTAQQLPLRKLYAVFHMRNLIINPAFDPEFDNNVRHRDHPDSLWTDGSWKTTKIGGQGWQWVPEAIGIQTKFPLPEGEGQDQAALPGSSFGVIEFSYARSEVMQVIKLIDTLVSRGLTESEAHAFMDSSPALELSVFLGSRHDCGAEGQVLLVLNSGERVLPAYVSRSDHPWQEDALASSDFNSAVDTVDDKFPHQGHWLQYTTVLKDYPRGVRRALVVLRGADTQFWAGHYGAKFAAPRLRVLLPGAVEAAVAGQGLHLHTSKNLEAGV